MATVRSATAAAISAARAAGRLKPWHEPSAAVALKLAQALTPSKLPSTELVRLSNELDKMLSRLPLAEPGPERGTDDRPVAPTGGAGPAGPHTPRLAAVMGSGPEVGDTALP